MKERAILGRIVLPADLGTLLERLRRRGYHLRADCGGEGTCGRCKVRFLSVAPSFNSEDEAWFTPEEISSGWRLACRHCDEAAELEYNPDWELRFAVETGDSVSSGVEVGLAVDVGTTGLVAALVDLSNGAPRLIARGYNPQRAWGADVMTRLVAARDPNVLNLLQKAILSAIRNAITTLFKEAPPLKRGAGGDILAVGNTAMIHFAAGVPETTLSVFPFHSPLEGRTLVPVSWNAGPLNLAGPLQGFVGSDLLAVLRALNLHVGERQPVLVLDLGTNSEIALWDGERYQVTSCAAGPAFEGGGISCGSAAGPGVAVEVRQDRDSWRLLPEDGQPKTGLCGSALIALLAQAVRSGKLNGSGKFLEGREILLQELPKLSLTQKDVRSLQLAKGAIRTGITVLARRASLLFEQIGRVVVTGAFARSLKKADLQDIGLVPAPAAEVVFINDGALLGAALALADEGEPFAALRPLITVVNLADEPDFQDLFLAGLELKPME